MRSARGEAELDPSTAIIRKGFKSLLLVAPLEIIVLLAITFLERRQTSSTLLDAFYVAAVLLALLIVRDLGLILVGWTNRSRD